MLFENREKIDKWRIFFVISTLVLIIAFVFVFVFFSVMNFQKNLNKTGEKYDDSDIDKLIPDNNISNITDINQTSNETNKLNITS